jgi:thiopeptide-type bacteriocin biosynthesis protein
MKNANRQLPYRAEKFFALRIPLLPFTTYLQWTGTLDSPAAEETRLHRALATDKEKLREGLRRLTARPEIREALYLASPTLDQSLEHWLRNPESERGQAAERVLVRYFQRMTCRCTPFGLFASHSSGNTGPVTRLALDSSKRLQRRTRLDRWTLGRLVNHFSGNRALREQLTYFPNSTLYRAAGRLRYTEISVGEQDARQFRLVAVAENDALLEILQRARTGASISRLSQALAEDEDVSLEEAEAFIHELIDSQMLVSDLEPAVTGPDPASQLAEKLARCSETAESGRLLQEALVEIGELDRTGIGQAPERYRQLGKKFESLPVPLDLSLLLQVDLFRPTPEIVLGPEVIRELEQSTALLQRISPRSKWDLLAAFKAAFERRYEQRWVPLLEALDPETGVGFPVEAGQEGTDAPLLENYVFGNASIGSKSAGPEWTGRDVYLYKRVQELAAQNIHEWALSEQDLNALEHPGTVAPVADSAAIFAVLGADSAQAVAEGRFQISYRHCYGPPGARLFSRFCHGDEELGRQTIDYLRREQQFRPGAVYAEIVFLSQPRHGNVLARPLLRDYELVLLGRSGHDPERQIPVNELLISVVDQRVVLYSERLGREIIPRLTSAAHHSGSLGVYEFLGLLQDQRGIGPICWNWGGLENERVLPRVTCGRTVLSRAQWRVEAGEFRPIIEARGDEQYRRVRQWKQERGLPRFCLLMDEDNELLLDLDNPLSIESFCDVVRKRKVFTLVENFPDPGHLAIQGPEGRYTSELIVPVLRVPEVAEPEYPAVPRRVSGKAHITESLAPGSDWLYFKLYGGQGTADLVLVEAIAAAVSELKSRGRVDHWFFIRYNDPDPHLRVRLQGNPAQLCAEALPGLYRHLNPMVEDGRLWRIELGTYQRETGRYGGPENMERAERLFGLDSEAVMDIIQCSLGDEGADLRWQLALAGADRWLRDFGFGLEDGYRLAKRARDAYLKEFHPDDKGPQGWFAERFRKERKALEPLVASCDAPDSEPMRQGLEALARRSRLSAPLISEIRELDAQGRLTVSLEELAHSLIHMHINRVLRSSQRLQELVIYEFLVRLYGSMIARQGKTRVAEAG